MRTINDLILVFTGDEVTVQHLRGELEAISVKVHIQNDFAAGVSAGFAVGVPTAIDLYIREKDMEKAAPVVKEFNDKFS